MHFQIFVRLKKGCFQFALKNPCFDPIPRMYVHYPKIRFQIPDPSLIEYIRPCCCRRVYFLFFACMMLENEKMMMVVDLDVFVTFVWKMMRPTYRALKAQKSTMFYHRSINDFIVEFSTLSPFLKS